MEVIDFVFGGIPYIGYKNGNGTMVGLEMSEKNANAEGICLKKFASLLAKQMEEDNIGGRIDGDGIFYNCLGFETDMYGEKIAIIGHIVKRETEEIVDTFKSWIDPLTIRFYANSRYVMGFSLFKEVAIERIGFLYKHVPDAKVALDWNMRTMALAYNAVWNKFNINQERFQVYRISLVGEKWVIMVKSDKTGNEELTF